MKDKAYWQIVIKIRARSIVEIKGGIEVVFQDNNTSIIDPVVDMDLVVNLRNDTGDCDVEDFGADR